MATSNSNFPGIGPLLSRAALPLAPLYWAASRLHGKWLGTGREASFTPSIPLVVVGALRAGGSGKTSVTQELARQARARGLRVAILAYRLGTGGGGPAASDPVMEVEEDADWRLGSEEALLLRRGTGARVFVTRNRWLAWRRLHDADIHRGEPFDLILSDDGFQDPRLEGALRILLQAPGEDPGVWDLLPAGRFRETRRGRERADLILEGPVAVASGQPFAAENGDIWAGEKYRFFRRMTLPPGIAADTPWVAVCGLGDNRRFLAELRAAGVVLSAVLGTRDHGVIRFSRLDTCARRFPGAMFLCTRKDFLKLTPTALTRFRFQVVEQTLVVDPRVHTLIENYRTNFPA